MCNETRALGSDKALSGPWRSVPPLPKQMSQHPTFHFWLLSADLATWGLPLPVGGLVAFAFFWPQLRPHHWTAGALRQVCLPASIPGLTRVAWPWPIVPGRILFYQGAFRADLEREVLVREKRDGWLLVLFQIPPCVRQRALLAAQPSPLWREEAMSGGRVQCGGLPRAHVDAKAQRMLGHRTTNFTQCCHPWRLVAFLLFL